MGNLPLSCLSVQFYVITFGADARRLPQVQTAATKSNLMIYTPTVLSIADIVFSLSVCVCPRKDWKSTDQWIGINHCNGEPYITVWVKKVAPKKLFAIFSLRLSIFPWNVASMLPVYIYTHTYQFWSIYLNIEQNGVNFSRSTRRFYRFQFQVS